MKRIIALTLAALLLFMVSFAAAEDPEEPQDFRTLAGLDEIERKLDAGATIDWVYYSDGYGFSTSEFRTSDPEEIRELWQALNRITVQGRTEESVTDWYPQIVFYFSDGTADHVSFEAHWLSLSTENYKLGDDDAFWSLTAAMVKRYESSAHPRATYLAKPLEGKYCAGIRSVSEDRINLSLYTEDRYEKDRIEQLQPGDTVIVNGKAYTAAALLIHGFVDSDGDGEADQSWTMIRNMEKNKKLLDSHEIVVNCDYGDCPDNFELESFELITAEDFDGYIAFDILENDECRAVVNDWNPCTYVGDTTVQLPLPDGFVFTGYMDNDSGAREFLEDISETYTPYNTAVWFADDQLMKVAHSDYPTGPEK